MHPFFIFVVLIVLLVMALPIGIALGLTSLSISVFTDVHVGLDYIVRNTITALDSTSLIAIPMFILAGNLMAKGGISERLFNIFLLLFGRRTAGIPIATILTCLFFGAISGSGPATVAAVGAMSLPVLDRLGYDKKFSSAMVATAGSLGVIIPPSIPLIVLGTAAGVSVGDLFLAGIMPGIVISLSLIAYSYLYCKVKGEDKEQIADIHSRLAKNGFIRVIVKGFWALMAPVIILGGIYGGIVTPTEASVVAVVYSIIVSAFIYRTMGLLSFFEILSDSVRITVPILIIVAFATVFGKMLTLIQFPQTLSQGLFSLTNSPVLIMLLILLLLLFVGMFIETLAAILIFTPILFPIALQLGYDPVHFGVVVVVALAIGYATPPVGVNLFVASSLTRVPILDIGKHAMPFILSFIIALLLITFVPQITLLFV